MTVAYNPNSTNTKGLEVLWPLAKSYALDAATKLLGMSLDQSVAQAIGTVKVPVSSIPVRGGTYLVEVYDGEDAVADVSAGITTLTAYPNEDVSGTGASAWRGNGGTSNIYAYIDESSPSYADYVYVASSSGEQVYAFRVNTGSLTLTNKRIVAVRLKCHASNTSLNGTFRMGLDIGGEQFFSGVYSGLSRQISVRSSSAYQYEWTTNPATGLAWTISDIQAFDTSNEVLLANQIAGIYVTDVQMEIDVQTAAENRLALGVLDDSAAALTAGAWNSVTLTTPTGGTWTKDASGRHLYVLRRTSDIGSLVIPLLDVPDGVSFASGWRPTVEASSGLVTDMGSERTEVFGLIQQTTAPADSVDSIAYAQQVAALVYTGQTAEQEFSDAAAVTYGQIAFYAKPNGATSPLYVKVKRRSDNVQMGSTLTFNHDDVLALANEGGGWRACRDTMTTPVVLAAATQYYVEFTSTASGEGSNYWSVLAYDTLDSGNGTTFGGTTDRAKVNGTEADRYDIPVTVSVSPTPMTGGGTALLQWPLTDGEGIAVETIDYVQVTWDDTSLGATFDHYQVQRSDDSGTTWETIARVYDEATAYFDDIEARRNVASDYRVRVVLTSGAASAWLTCGSETPTLEAGRAVLASNWEFASSLAFVVENAPAWASNEPSTLAAPFGVDGMYAFRSSERRYRSASAVVYPVEQLSTTGRAGIGAFEALAELLAQQIPYVAVLDHRGDRWLADIVIGAEDEQDPGTYRQAITITELTREAVPVQITAVAA